MNTFDDAKKKAGKSKMSNKPANGSKMAQKSNGYGTGYKDTVKDAKNSKNLSSDEMMAAKMAGSGLPGVKTMPSSLGQNPNQGKSRSGRTVDPSEWQQAGQEEFSRALGQPNPRQAYGGPGGGKNPGTSEFGGKGKRVV